MADKILQLCNSINKNASKINLLSDAIVQAIRLKSIQGFQQILNLMIKLHSQQSLKEFISTKAKASFLALFSIIKKNKQPQLFKLLSAFYDLIQDKYSIVEQIDINQWNNQWPLLLLINQCQYFTRQIQNNKQKIDWHKIVTFILQLPSFQQLNQKQKYGQTFKKAFQKLLLLILSSEIDYPLKISLYRNLGSKILSKLHQPLCLSNHFLSKFLQTPQVRIQVLSCLFILVGKYGLELQKFYVKLEEVIKYKNRQHSIYQLPNSKRFFKLLQDSLRSSKIPFSTIRNFAQIIIKQIAGEKTNFAFWALSLIVNLTKKHRKLIDTIPKMPEITCLKHHYNPKIRGLVAQLFKNLNKIQYLEINQFTNIQSVQLGNKKMQSAINSLQNSQLQFRMPIFQQKL